MLRSRSSLKSPGRTFSKGSANSSLSIPAPTAKRSMARTPPPRIMLRSATRTFSAERSPGRQKLRTAQPAYWSSLAAQSLGSSTSGHFSLLAMRSPISLIKISLRSRTRTSRRAAVPSSGDTPAASATAKRCTLAASKRDCALKAASSAADSSDSATSQTWRARRSGSSPRPSITRSSYSSTRRRSAALARAKRLCAATLAARAASNSWSTDRMVSACRTTSCSLTPSRHSSNSSTSSSVRLTSHALSCSKTSSVEATSAGASPCSV
mmetsp:Transcript_18153/g.31854  ORF Transcript_18153/g.31854 Transcript_18153/m.31854 type:complete len:267 (-) Transcript_18153:680-1480(-)